MIVVMYVLGARAAAFLSGRAQGSAGENQEV